jgi:hypothetical protein
MMISVLVLALAGQAHAPAIARLATTIKSAPLYLDEGMTQKASLTTPERVFFGVGWIGRTDVYELTYTVGVWDNGRRPEHLYLRTKDIVRLPFDIVPSSTTEDGVWQTEHGFSVRENRVTPTAPVPIEELVGGYELVIDSLGRTDLERGLTPKEVEEKTLQYTFDSKKVFTWTQGKTKGVGKFAYAADSTFELTITMKQGSEGYKVFKDGSQVWIFGGQKGKMHWFKKTK